MAAFNMSFAVAASTLGRISGSTPCLSGVEPRVIDRKTLHTHEHHPLHIPRIHPINDVIHNTVVINVSGNRFETYQTTLKRFPNTLLGNPTKLSHFYNHTTGEYFFDRNRKAFNGILYFYQSNGILEYPPGISESLFMQEVLFFELPREAWKCDESESELEDEEYATPSNPFLYKIWILFEFPNSSIGSKILVIFAVLMILLSIVVFCVETVPKLNIKTVEGFHMSKMWVILNYICNCWFTLEYLLRFIVAPKKVVFLRSWFNIIDVISIIPFYVEIIGFNDKLDQSRNDIPVLEVIRIIRVSRIFKLSRHSRGLQVFGMTIKSSIRELFMLTFFMATSVILFSSFLYYAELQNKDTKFKSIPAAFWWAIVTMTTLGYGDLVPTTLLGKLSASVCILTGLLLIAFLLPIIAKNFELSCEEDKIRQEKKLRRKEKLDNKILLMKRKQTMKMEMQPSIEQEGQLVNNNSLNNVQKKNQREVEREELDTSPTHIEEVEEYIRSSSPWKN